MGVEYVVVTNLTPAAMGATREARLVVTPGDGFRAVFRFRSGTVFELLHPTSILTGPRPARITAVSHLEISGWAAAPGRYLLRVHYTPYWHLTGLPACIGAGAGGMTSLDLKRGGRFSLAMQPTLNAVGARIFDNDQPRPC